MTHTPQARPQPAGLPVELRDRVKALALALGFDLAGVARAEATPETAFLREWLARGYAGEMHYLARRVEERVDPRRVLDGAESVIAVGLVYDPGTHSQASGPRGQVARYAGGDDYHDVMRDRLRGLEAGLEALAGRPLRCRTYVDTGPVQERVFAAYAGLGWICKNSCLIHPTLGSYLFLGVVLTDLSLTPDAREPDSETIITPQHESLLEPVAQAVSDTLPFQRPEPGAENDAEEEGDEIHLIPGDPFSAGAPEALTGSH